MAENRTHYTGASVADYLAAIEDDARREDCKVLGKLLAKVTRHRPKMWGPSIVGFGNYHYRYQSGHEGEAPVAGFSSRKPDITVYLTAGSPGQEALLARLGKHKMGRSCLYIRRLADVDLRVLEQLVAGSVAEVRRMYPPAPSAPSAPSAASAAAPAPRRRARADA